MNKGNVSNLTWVEAVDRVARKSASVKKDDYFLGAFIPKGLNLEQAADVIGLIYSMDYKTVLKLLVKKEKHYDSNSI